MNTTFNQSEPQVGRSFAADLLCYGSKGHAALSIKFDGFVNIVTDSAVFKAVLALTDKLKIGWVVVTLVFVFMVNLFAAFKFSAKLFLHHKPMFINLSSIWKRKHSIFFNAFLARIVMRFTGIGAVKSSLTLPFTVGYIAAFPFKCFLAMIAFHTEVRHA